jgi:predicted ATPase/DNA-binding SARP family transcriptional activator
VEYRVLGPLEVRGVDGPLPLGGPKQRAVLALLLLNANRVVGRERLIHELWGDEPPETAATTVQVYVSRLRKVLPSDVLQTRPPGYVLTVDPEEIDLLRFERLVAESHHAEPQRAGTLLRASLALWRGSALEEFDEPFARLECSRLEEARLAALEARIEADLALGMHADLVSELRSVIGEHPHREGLRRQLMLALYRSGRQAEALSAYRDARGVLDELGIAPSTQLRRLEKQILRQDATLEPPHSRAEPLVVGLPVPATSFVGRERELAEVADVLCGGDTRVVTLAGAAGSGKSRLALEVASRVVHAFPDGVFFVALEDLRDPALVVPAVANALGVDAMGNAVEAAVAERLVARRALLVVDNFEQVLAAAPAVARLASETSVFMVTSRAPLNIAAERQYPVPALAQSEARALFVERARAVRPDFETSHAVGEICRRLDGLPLAIELAAARVRLMAPDAMLPRLSARLSLLTGGPRERPTRQQTLRAALDWSYDLLTVDARELFARLAVFAAGFDLEAVEGVCDGDLETFRALVDNGLVQPRGKRFALLESIREYSVERFAVDPGAEAVRLKHAEYYSSLGERLLDEDRSDGDKASASRSLAADLANFEAAHELLRNSALPVEELRVAEAHANALERVGRTRDALDVLEQALRTEDLGTRQRGSLEAQAAWFAAYSHDFAKARVLASLALDDTRRAGDSWHEITALAAIWLIAYEEGELAQADAALAAAEAIARAAVPHRLASVVNDRAVIALQRGEYGHARELLSEGLEVARGTPYGPWFNLALSHLLEGDFDAAEPWLKKTITHAREANATNWLFYALHGFVVVHAETDPERAALLSGAVESLGRSIGIQLQPLELRLMTQTRSDLACRLGGLFHELETAGAEMHHDEATELALGSLVVEQRA